MAPGLPAAGDPNPNLANGDSSSAPVMGLLAIQTGEDKRSVRSRPTFPPKPSPPASASKEMVEGEWRVVVRSRGKCQTPWVKSPTATFHLLALKATSLRRMLILLVKYRREMNPAGKI